MNKRILALALSIIMMLGMMPMSASASDAGADATECYLWAGGVQFTSENLEIDSSDDADITGSATYEPTTNTLTLNDFTVSKGYTYINDQGYSDLFAIFYGGNTYLRQESTSLTQATTATLGCGLLSCL